MQEEAQQPYTPAELAALLHISVPTLRKYSLLIEKVTGNSHYFTRNQQNVRAYSEKDLASLKELAELSKQPNMTLQSAAEQIYRPAQSQIITGLKKKPTPVANTEQNPAGTGTLIRQLVDELRSTQQLVTKLEQRVAKLEAQRAPAVGAAKVARVSATLDPEVDSRRTMKEPAPRVAPSPQTTIRPTTTVIPPAATQPGSASSSEKPAPTTVPDPVASSASQLKFTEPLPSDDPTAASDATHHLVYQDEPQPADPGVKVYDKPHDLAAMQIPAEKKQSWWQKIRSNK